MDQELEKLKAQLADLSSHYTDRHPDVRKLKDQIAKTEKMRDQALADLKATAATTSGTSNASRPLHEQTMWMAEMGRPRFNSRVS